MRLDRPLVLVGLMGAGKSRLARVLADALDLPCIDSDDEIEKAAGMTIPEIFARFGEPYFRDGERRVIRRLLDGRPRVIATGGGAVMTPETAAAIAEDAVSIWVRADLDIIRERVARNDKRPLITGKDVDEVLQAMVRDRYPVYERADIVVESHNGPQASILNQALARIDAYLRSSVHRQGKARL